MDEHEHDQLTGEFEAFAAEVAHELRTPLSALSGEVELALRRERPPAAYREALTRIAASVAELVDLTAHLRSLGQTLDATDMGANRAPLDAMLARIAERFHARAGDVQVHEAVASAITVAGDEALLNLALTLLVEHGVRHRRDAERVRLSVAPPGAVAAMDTVTLVLDAGPAGFVPYTWQFLVAAEADPEQARQSLTGSLRLRTAERIVRDCGGSLHVAAVDGREAVQIRLRRA